MAFLTSEMGLTVYRPTLTIGSDALLDHHERSVARQTKAQFPLRGCNLSTVGHG